MRIRSPLGLGLAIRGRRRDLKMTQAALARKADVGRQWLVALERGQSHRAQLDMVLRTLNAIDLPLTIDAGGEPHGSSHELPAIDLDAVVNAHKRP